MWVTLALIGLLQWSIYQEGGSFTHFKIEYKPIQGPVKSHFQTSAFWNYSIHKTPQEGSFKMQTCGHCPCNLSLDIQILLELLHVYFNVTKDCYFVPLYFYFSSSFQLKERECAQGPLTCDGPKFLQDRAGPLGRSPKYNFCFLLKPSQDRGVAQQCPNSGYHSTGQREWIW